MISLTRLIMLGVAVIALGQAHSPARETKQTTQPAASAAAQSFDDQLVQANVLFKQGKLDEALAAAQAAQKLDAKRFEAPATAALILHTAKKPTEAKAALDEAAKLAPADKQEKVQSIAKVLSAETAPTTSGNPPALTGAARRQFDTLALIIEEADKATTDSDRKKLLQEFLEKSEPFLKANPKMLPMWTLRAVASLELNQENEATQAGAELTRLGAENSDDPKLRKVMAMLDRKGWLKTPQQITEANAAEERRQSQAKAEEERRQSEGRAEAEQRRAERQRRHEEEAAAQQLINRFAGTFVSDWLPASWARKRFAQISLVVSPNKTIRVFIRYRDKLGGKVESDANPDMGWDNVSLDKATKELVTDAPPWRLSLDESGSILSLDLPEDVRKQIQGKFGDLGRQLRREK